MQAGDAGSSPAPVTNPGADERGRSDGLMGYVANVIQQQLDEHEARKNPTALVLGMVAKLWPEVRMLALGLV